MVQYLPVMLSGDTLGQRHHCLNLRVLQAANELTSFSEIQTLPEETPVDRLFKIDLANKLKNVDYIIKTVKDDDMMYVSRALKCKWLVEQREIMNPKYLEDVLFPEMVMPAISKMKHWLYINIRNPLMSQEFYTFYKDSKFDYAVKFLSHCNEEFVFNEFPKILTQITPHYLKVLGEKYPKLVKIYFDSLATNNKLVNRYLQEEEKFYKNINCVLKLEPGIFLDITEKYHNLRTTNKLGPSMTNFILRYHKSRFLAKPELYVVYLLHIPTVAQCLSVEECQEVVIKLARADYLSWWFSYAKVEPLVKRVSRDQRAAFKKLVFVEKKVGDRVDKWPYALPASPEAKDKMFDGDHVFHDIEYNPIEYMDELCCDTKKCLRYCQSSWVLHHGPTDYRDTKTELEKLFDEFRFMSYENTLHELSLRVGSAMSADRRRDMLLVLVSKSGGRADSVRSLMELAMRLHNEPVHERAAVVRSLVKRASAWRLPQDVWDTILEYGRGLGLDGSKPEVECREGLHAVVLRQLLATGDCEPVVRCAFLDAFSTLMEYKLVANERVTIAAGLQRILATAAADAAPEMAATRLGQMFNVLEKYHIPLKSSQIVSSVAALAERDTKAATSLLVRLYEARVGRRELLRQYLKLRHDDAALLNALRHDPDAVTPEWLIELLIDNKTKANQFFFKLAVYFGETNGSAQKIRRLLQEKISQDPNVKLARPLARLAGDDIRSIWRQLDEAGDKHKKLTAALRANMHCARPAPDALTLGWRKAGMKAVAWRAMRCRPAQVTQLAQTLLEKRVKRTVRLALALAPRTKYAADLFSIAATIRRPAALRAALLYIRKLGDEADLRIWDIVKPIISSVDLLSCRGLRHLFINVVKMVPGKIQPDYCAILYLALDKISDRNANNILSRLMNQLPAVDDDLFEAIVLNISANLYNNNTTAFPAIIIRYLMLSKNTDELESRFKKIGEPFLEKITEFRDKDDESKQYLFELSFYQLVGSLQYNAAFFDITYQCCIPVIERVKTWMGTFLPKEKYFTHYVTIHTTVLYYKAVRQSIEQNAELFQDPRRKLTEGVDIVGYAFGRYVVKELLALKSEYFDSITELYSNAFIKYLRQNIIHDFGRKSFLVAIIKGILSASKLGEARLAIYVLQCEFHSDNDLLDEMNKLLAKYKNNEVIYFAAAAGF